MTMMRKPGLNSRPPFPYAILELSEDEYVSLLKAGGYSDRMVEKELVKYNQFHDKYRPTIKKTVNDVPINDEEDQAYKALKRKQEKANNESSTR